MGSNTLSPMAAELLHLTRRTTTQPKLKFLALKWAGAEHFKQHLAYQSFLVRTDNNPLTYIMTTPNLDATGHLWVGALVQFSFELEYQKGHDNIVADLLSQVTTLTGPGHSEINPQWSQEPKFMTLP